MASSTSTPFSAIPQVDASKPKIIDDKSPHCIPFILSRLEAHRLHRSQSQSQTSSPKPFVIGLNGVQGAGKTTLVSTLASTLRQQSGLEILVCSIDDLYLSHSDQVALATTHKDNPLVQHRGEPGTHDMHLAKELLEALKQGKETKIPQYDKSAFNGQGDRVPSERWESVNGPGQPGAQVIIFEGWCVGFRALSEEDIEVKQQSAKKTLDERVSTLPNHRLDDLLFINSKLKEYDIMTDSFNAFIHIDAKETGYVYEWRLQQEAALRREKGTGMTDEQVVRFVDGYYPAYELFTDALRRGVFMTGNGVLEDGEGDRGKQLRLVVDRDRRVREVIEI